MNLNLSLVVYHVLMHQAEEGGYWCEILEVPGCVAQGETEKEAFLNLKDVLRLTLSSVTSTSTGSSRSPEQP